MAGGRFLGIGIAAHLDDIEPPVRVVADAHGIGHERLDSDRLEVETRMDRGTTRGPRRARAA